MCIGILYPNNVHAADEYTETVIIEKEWVDGDNALNSRPSNLELYINEQPNNLDTVYAVSVWDIGVDKNSSNKTMGLTIGRAFNGNYVTSHREHSVDKNGHITGSDRGTTTNGHAYRCFHHDSWEQIVYWNNVDPYVYDKCIKNLCSHKLYINFPSLLKSTTYSYPGDLSKGDGVTSMRPELIKYVDNNPDIDTNRNYQHVTLNPLTTNGNGDYGTNYGGWGASRMRAVLNGADSLTMTGTNYANKRSSNYDFTVNVNQYTASQSVFGGFPQALKDSIGLRKTPYYDRNTLKYSNDKLWLPSVAEISNGTVDGLWHNDEGSVYKIFRLANQNPVQGNQNIGQENNFYKGFGLWYDSISPNAVWDWSLRSTPTTTRTNSTQHSHDVVYEYDFATIYLNGGISSDHGSYFNGLSPSFSLDSQYFNGGGYENSHAEPKDKLNDVYLNGFETDAQWVKSGNKWTKTLTNVKVDSSWSYYIGETSVPANYKNTQSNTISINTTTGVKQIVYANSCKLTNVGDHTWKCTLKNELDGYGYAEVRFIDKANANNVLKVRARVGGKAGTKIVDSGYTTDLNNFLTQYFRLISNGFDLNPVYGLNDVKQVDIILESAQLAQLRFLDKDRDNELMSERPIVRGYSGDLIVDTDYLNDDELSVKYFKTLGYELSSDPIATDKPKYDDTYDNTQIIDIILEHTYTEVNKETYEKDKCLNDACSVKQPEKGC